MKVTTKKTMTVKTRNFQGKINHRENLEHLITEPIEGTMGAYVALREAVNNSVDAGATDIRIWFEKTKQGKILVIADNGKGFSHKGVDSAMSYAFSAQDREDVRTSGANGTGLKSFLGLGPLDKTILTVQSISNEFVGECISMEITFNYLVDLAEKKGDANDYVSFVEKPKDWNKALKRTTGTNIILSGYDGRKLKTAEQIIKEFSAYLTPKVSSMVKVFNDLEWKEIKPFGFKGEKYDISFETKSLGNVEFDVYYNGSAEGPMVCGPLNSILSLNDVYSKFSQEQKKEVGKIWRTIGGHIYIERANVFRKHNGTLSDKFYLSPASDELVNLLSETGKEIAKFSELEKQEALSKRRGEWVEKIIQASQEVNPPSVFKKDQNGSNKNKGGTEMARKTDSNDSEKNQTGGNTPMHPFIHGPKYILPNGIYPYRLERYNEESIYFNLDDKLSGISLLPGTTGRRSATIKVAKDTKEQSFTLSVMHKGKEITRKKINVVENMNARPPEPVINFAGEDYYVTVGFLYPKTIAQVEYFFSETTLTTIMVNTIHERIKDLNVMLSIDHMLVAIAYAAAIDQVSQGKVNKAKATEIAEEFIASIKKKMFAKEPKE